MAVNNLVTMDHVKSFFSPYSKVEPLELAPMVTGGLGIDNTHEFPVDTELLIQRDRTTDYAQAYVEEEEQNDIALACNSSSHSNFEHGLNELEELSTAVGDLQLPETLDAEAAEQIYSSYYKSDVQYDSSLSIYKYRNQILQLVSINQAVIIQGPTGCGKTTQVPQYILDHHVKLGHHCNIIVTQPRKIAAISIARRVCEERNWRMGGIVGYQVAMDNKTSPDTRLSFVTTGVLLQKLVNSRRMDMYTHVILDEVHERDQDTDFALLVVKKLLRTNSKRVKVILMSATIDPTIFANYFSLPGQREPASVITVEGKSKEVTEHYLQELSGLGVPLPELSPENPCISPACYDLVLKLMFIFDRIEKSEQDVPNESEYAPVRGSVLIFLPGYDEISIMTNKLRPASVSRNYSIFPLHSAITLEEQTKVFKRANQGYRKVIISTNIAESSITVPDIKYVIDFCLTKNIVCDPDTNYTSLRLEWASKANCIQRKGRAGRVDIGKVYRMVTREFYEMCLPEYTIPELKRCPLDQTVLFAKKLNFGPPHALLALALEPPAFCDIENAVLNLKQVGALAVTANGIVSQCDGDLTFVGRVMSTLPLDVRISKLIIYGYVFNCLEDCIIIAASLSLKSFFSRPFQQLLDSYKTALSWADGTFSDCLSYLNAYKIWKDFSTQGQFNRPGGFRELEWARSNFLQLKRLKEVDMLVEEIKKRLISVNINTANHHRPKGDPTEEVLVLKLVIAGAFFPYYFCQEPIEERVILRQISNNDPLSTVYITGLPPNHGVLYYSALYDMLKVCSPRMSIQFEERKAYVQFEHLYLGADSKCFDSASVLPAVYFAVKMRELRMHLELQVFSHEDAERKLEQLKRLQHPNEGKRRLSSNRMTVASTPDIQRVPLPPINRLVIQIKVCHVLNPGYFWARYVDQKYQMDLDYIFQTLNMGNKSNLKKLDRKPTINMFVIAPYEEQGSGCYYYRAIIQDIIDANTVSVFFIDYGNTSTLPVGNLRLVDTENYSEIYKIPAFAFECQLSGIKPSAVKCGFGWSAKSKKWFYRKVGGKILNARVFSVVQNIVRVELHEHSATISINAQLVNEGYAEHAEESLLSKQNFDERAKAELVSLQLVEPDEKPSHLMPSDVEETMRKTLNKVRLHGPFSPLEARFCGMTFLDHCKSIKINQDSVNSVTLDPEPQDQHRQMLVASSISLGQRSHNLMLRNTTLLPKIKDLASLLCLIFAPAAEYRTDPERSAYTGAICGLGCDPATGIPLYHEQDIELAFESEITNQDVCEINSLRMGINLVLGSEDEIAEWSHATIADLQKKLRKKLLVLIQRNRAPRVPYDYPRRYKWMQVPTEYLLKSELPKNVDNPSVLQLHQGIDLCERKSLHSEMVEHLDHLKSLAGRTLRPFVEHIKCRLCDIVLENSRAVLLHLDTSEHQEKEAMLHI